MKCVGTMCPGEQMAAGGEEGMWLNNCPERKGESLTGRIYINLPRVLRKRN